MGIREQIISDVSRRNFVFPTFSDLKLPLRSTFTGKIVSQESAGSATLLELIVDMIVVQPIRWDAIVSELSKSPVSRCPVHLLAIGPGTSLANVTRKALAGDVSIIDINRYAEESATQEPIAIVGMSLNMPGASETSQLWHILEEGINTVSQVNACTISYPPPPMSYPCFLDPRGSIPSLGIQRGSWKCVSIYESLYRELHLKYRRF